MVPFVWVALIQKDTHHSGADFLTVWQYGKGTVPYKSSSIQVLSSVKAARSMTLVLEGSHHSKTPYHKRDDGH